MKGVKSMAVFRIERTRDYTVMSNHHLRNEKLSLKAKGLLSMMLSLPENWNYTTRGLATICKEGVVDLAKGQVGNVGGQPYWSWYGFTSRVEWCACFVSWCYGQMGLSEPRFAACQSQDRK